jgi:hypothetical protein
MHTKEKFPVLERQAGKLLVLSLEKKVRQKKKTKEKYEYDKLSNR